MKHTSGAKTKKTEIDAPRLESMRVSDRAGRFKLLFRATNRKIHTFRNLSRLPPATIYNNLHQVAQIMNMIVCIDAFINESQH